MPRSNSTRDGNRSTSHTRDFSITRHVASGKAEGGATPAKPRGQLTNEPNLQGRNSRVSGGRGTVGAGGDALGVAGVSPEEDFFAEVRCLLRLVYNVVEGHNQQLGVSGQGGVALLQGALGQVSGAAGESNIGADVTY